MSPAMTPFLWSAAPLAVLSGGDRLASVTGGECAGGSVAALVQSAGVCPLLPPHEVGVSEHPRGPSVGGNHNVYSKPGETRWRFRGQGHN